MVPNPCLTNVTELESELKSFINNNNPSVVNDVTRHMHTKMGGLGMLNVNFFGGQLECLG